jgi:hypothetical protein
MADIDVSITDSTQVVSQEGFGKALAVCTTKDMAYKEYDVSDDLELVQKDFTTDTEMYKIIETFASQNPRPRKIAVFGKDLKSSLDKGKDLVTELNTLITEHNNWYRIILEETEEKLVDTVSSWAETNKKMYFTQLDTTEFTTDFTDRKRTVLNYKENKDRLDVGMVGYATTRIPGTFTYKFKNIKNITADKLSGAKIKEAKAKMMNCYIKKFEILGVGSSQLESGLTASGDYIDHIESMDWVKFRIEVEIAKLLMTSEKVPYDNTGIQSVVTAVRIALEDAAKKGIIMIEDGSPVYTITYKNWREIPQEDRQRRKLTGIKFNYAEAGAIEEVKVSGAVTLDLGEKKEE